MTEWIGVAIAIFTQFITVLVGYVRLQSRVSHGEEMRVQLKEELRILQLKHEELDSKIVQELSRLRESVARIEGLLSKH